MPFFRETGFSRTSTSTPTVRDFSWLISAWTSLPSYPMLTISGKLLRMSAVYGGFLTADVGPNETAGRPLSVATGRCAASNVAVRRV